jgi:putative hydrolase of the HAD superfamily
MIESGGWGIYVPHGLKWEIEHAEPLLDHSRYHEIETLAAFPELLNRILED